MAPGQLMVVTALGSSAATVALQRVRSKPASVWAPASSSVTVLVLIAVMGWGNKAPGTGDDDGSGGNGDGGRTGSNDGGDQNGQRGERTYAAQTPHPHPPNRLLAGR